MLTKVCIVKAIVFPVVMHGTPLQYSCLENPMDGRAWWAAVHGVAKSRTWLSDFTLTFHFHALEKEMATHSSVPSWRIPGTVETGGLPSMESQSRTQLKWLSSSSSDIFANFLKMDCVLLILLVSFWWGRPWFSFYTKKVFKFFFFQLTFESFHFWTPHLPSTSELSSFYLSTKIALLSNVWFLTVSFLFSIYPAITVLISIFWLFVLSLLLSPLYHHSDYS